MHCSTEIDRVKALFLGNETSAALELLESYNARVANDPEALFLHGTILLELERSDEAVAFLERATAMRPNMTNALVALSDAYCRIGENDRAIELLRAVVQRVPGHSGCTELATLLMGKALPLTLDGRDADALPLLQEAASLNCTLPDVLFHLGSTLGRLGQYDASLAILRHSLQLYPDHPLAMVNMASALDSLNLSVEAESVCRRVVDELMPDLAAAWCNLGASLRSQGRLDEARSAFLKALELDPELVAALVNLGTVCSIEGEHDECRRLYRQALALSPELPIIQFMTACDRLKAGDWEAGWALYEHRGRHSARIRWDDIARLPVWTGGDPSGLRLLVETEQGFGDSLHFFRYAVLLADRGAHVGLVAPKPLIRLFRLSDPRLRVMEQGALEDTGEWDYGIPLMSLPYRFGTRPDTVPADVPYLFADAAQSQAWAHRIAELPGLKIGLVWAGDARPYDPAAWGIDRRRSVSLATLGPLAEIEGVSFISLQKGPPAAQIASSQLRVVDWTNELDDFADTAALVSQLDLVVAVDTSVAHLAGGLGRPVMLLSRYDGCWRWLRDRDDTPWYPTMRLFRQHRWGDWSSPVAALTEALNQFGRRASC